MSLKRYFGVFPKYSSWKCIFQRNIGYSTLCEVLSVQIHRKTYSRSAVRPKYLSIFRCYEKNVTFSLEFLVQRYFYRKIFPGTLTHLFEVQIASFVFEFFREFFNLNISDESSNKIFRQNWQSLDGSWKERSRLFFPFHAFLEPLFTVFCSRSHRHGKRQ